MEALSLASSGTMAVAGLILSSIMAAAIIWCLQALTLPDDPIMEGSTHLQYQDLPHMPDFQKAVPSL